MRPLHLVGHDGSSRGDDALAFAGVLAAVHDAQLVVANIVPLTPLVPGPLEAELGLALREEADAQLADLRASVQAMGAELRSVTAASAARGLHDLAEELGADLLVVGSSHRGHFGLAVAGTVADRLVHGSPCPVALAPLGFAEGPKTVTSILVGYDASDEAREALRIASALATKLGARVHVVAVAEVGSWAATPGAAMAMAEAMKAVHERCERIADEALALVPEAQRGQRMVLDGPTAPGITDACKAVDADLVITGSRGYGPAGRVLAGSVARHLFHHAPCAVLAVPRTAHVHLGEAPPAQDAVETAS